VEPVSEFVSTFLANVELDPAAIDKYAPGFEDDPRTAQVSNTIAEALGVTEIQEILGAGSYGVAAALSDARVIKLTTDSTEVEAGAVLASVAEQTNVVRVYGSWFLRGVYVHSNVGFNPKKETAIVARRRVGLLVTERVVPLTDLDIRAAYGLSEFVREIKIETKTWPNDLLHLSKARARTRLMEASMMLEGALRQIYEEQGERIAGDVAQALGELRSVGVYAIDVHGGNVGWIGTERGPVFKVFDIGMSSTPTGTRAPPLAPGIVSPEVTIAEL
jgi:hypothetical protein